MPDGGRDAAVTRKRTDYLVFQVKFRRPTPLAEAHYLDFLEWLQRAIEPDLDKVKRLAERGLREYVIITNVPASSHGDTGTNAKMRAWLAERVPDGVETNIWWRGEVDRRLDGQWSIKRSYGLVDSAAEGEHLLDAMLAGYKLAGAIQGRRTPESRRRTTIRKFLAAQFDKEANIRFREADLPLQPLLSSYLDIRAEFTAIASAKDQRLAVSQVARRISSNASRRTAGVRTSNQVRAAEVVLFYQNIEPLQNLVIEGAPGQGKSTLIQYVCQVHRARFLGKEAQLAAVPPEYRTSPILLPFRADLRDVSVWLLGGNPFASTQTHNSYPRSVEGFLAALVSDLAGGASFTVDDLDATLVTTPAILAFDGLDEVAEIDARRQVVDELAKCATRLHEISSDLRIIVSSRPSAFAAAPRLPGDSFSYMTLANLTPPLIIDYARTWAKARNVDAGETEDLIHTLVEKLEEPHIAELARNSMQLAILLWLMYQQTGTLPDQRTRLYEEYIKTFLNREAGKDEVIRKYREPILQLHGYLAWVLHARAESDSSPGNISQDEMKDLMRSYLLAQGYSQGDLVDRLFQGMVERVVALVSRVQGTYEFEVQPLREYFAAQHLYSNARYSPAGAPVQGTKADIFDAISQNPYWQNVTRFYVGFFDKGELAYLLHRFQYVFSHGAQRLLSYPRTLANTILADQVFGQSPAAGAALAASLVAEPIGWYALAQGSGGSVLTLPADSGGSEIVTRAKAELVGPRLPYTSRVLRVLSELGHPDDVPRWWLAEFWKSDLTDRDRWLGVGESLGVFDTLPPCDIVPMFANVRDDIDLGWVFRTGRAMSCMDDSGIAAGLLRYFASGLPLPVSYPPRDIFELAMALLVEHRRLPFTRDFDQIIQTALQYNALTPLADFAATVYAPQSKYRRGNAAAVVDLLESKIGSCWLVEKTRLIALLPARPVTADGSKYSPPQDIFDASVSPQERQLAANLMSDRIRWWQRQFESADSFKRVGTVSVLVLRYGSERVIERLLPRVNTIAASWSTAELLSVLDSVAGFNRRAPSLRISALEFSADSSPIALVGLAERARLDQKAPLLSQAIDNVDDMRVKKYVIDMLLDVCMLRLARTGRWVGGREYSLRYAADSPPTRAAYLYQFRADGFIDHATAVEILQRATFYPPIAVELADESVSRELTAELQPVARIARVDGWFDGPQPF
jgi:hypothetical protein